MIPDNKWGLQQWLDGLGVRDTDLAQILFEQGFKSSKRHIAQYIYDIKSNSRPQKIATHEDAVHFIKALNQLAMQKKSDLMSCQNLQTHMEIFLSSPKICSHRFIGLQESEIETLCKNTAQVEFSGFDLLERVHPKPPVTLFGRDQDIINVLENVKTYPVTIVSGIAGNGKTSLTWFSAKQIMERGMAEEFDWTTDKRYVLDQYGNEVQTGIKPLNFNAILRSMISRFDWSDLIGKMDNDLVKYCTHRLQQKAYLLIIDNLETIADSEQLVEHLLTILALGSNNPPVSRAIITSRYSVKRADCANIVIGGIAEPDRFAYITYLLSSYLIPSLSNRQIHDLAEVTQGNPLFIQIALQRLSITPHAFPQIIDDLRSGRNFMTVFHNLFAPLVADLKENQPQAYWLMICAAHLTVIEESELLLYWSEVFGNTIEYYYKALSILKSKMILGSANTGELAMHSLIQAYLRGISF